MLGRFFHDAYLAVTDFEHYRRVFDQPVRLTLLFLLFLAAFNAIALTLINAWFYSKRVDDFFAWAGGNLPVFEVTEGRLRVDADQPLVLKYHEKATWTLVFDTTGTYQDPQGFDEPAVLFARENLLLMFGGQTQTYSWSDFGDFGVTPEDLPYYNSLFRWLYFPLAYAFFLVYSMLGKAIQAVILSPLAFSVASGYGVRLRFLNCFTIGLYALVPATVIDLGVEMTGLNISYFSLIYIAVAAIYTYLATQKCSVVEI
jgi:hypothetical protein